MSSEIVILDGARVALYLIECCIGIWLSCSYAVDNLGSLDWKVTIRGISAFLSGIGLFIHGGVSATHLLEALYKLAREYDL